MDTNENKRSKGYIFNASFIAYFCIMLALVLLRLLFLYGVFDFAGDEGMDLIFTFISQILILGLAPVLIISLLFKKGVKGTLDYLQVKKPKPYIFIAFAIAICGYLVNIAVNLITTIIYSALGWHSGGGAARTSYPVWLLLLNIVFISVFPAICEEITHRGLVLKAMKTGGASDAKIIFMNGLFFGLFHMYLGQTAFTLVMGCIMALLVVKSKSIIPAVIMHFTNNFISVMIEFISVKMPASDAPATDAEILSTFGVILLLCALGITGFVLLILLFIKRARKAGDCPPKKKFIPPPPQYGMGNFFAPPQFQCIQLSAQPRHFAAAIQPRNQSNYYFNPYAPQPPVQYPVIQQQPFGWQVQPGLPANKIKLSAKYKVFYFATIILAGAITIISFITGL